MDFTLQFRQDLAQFENPQIPETLTLEMVLTSMVALLWSSDDSSPSPHDTMTVARLNSGDGDFRAGGRKGGLTGRCERQEMRESGERQFSSTAVR